MGGTRTVVKAALSRFVRQIPTENGRSIIDSQHEKVSRIGIAIGINFHIGQGMVQLVVDKIVRFGTG